MQKHVLFVLLACTSVTKVYEVICGPQEVIGNRNSCYSSAKTNKSKTEPCKPLNADVQGKMKQIADKMEREQLNNTPGRGSPELDKRRFVRRMKRKIQISKTVNFVHETCIENNTASECLKQVVNNNHGYDWTLYPLGLELNVTFFERNGCWNARITWKWPAESNTTSCIGYEIHWFHYIGSLFDQDSCYTTINKNVTSFVINPLRGWHSVTYQDTLDVVVFPLPSKEEGFSLTYRTFHRTNEESTPSLFVASTGNTITSTVQSEGYHFKKTGNNYAEEQSSEKSENDRLVLKLTVASGLGIAAIFFILCVVICRRKIFQPTSYFVVKKASDPAKNAHYISYYAEDEATVQSAVWIASWLRSKGINVVIDKFDVITSRKRVWRETQLAQAKRIIIIVSPKYLEILKLGETATKQNNANLEEQLAWNEVCQIRHKLLSKPWATDHVVVVLMGTSSMDLPFWMSALGVFKYNNGVFDENILNVL